jgi:hypothetical protein
MIEKEMQERKEATAKPLLTERNKTKKYKELCKNPLTPDVCKQKGRQSDS